MYSFVYLCRSMTSRMTNFFSWRQHQRIDELDPATWIASFRQVLRRAGDRATGEIVRTIAFVEWLGPLSGLEHGCPTALSKLETIMFIRELARRTAGTGVDALAFHPASWRPGSVLTPRSFGSGGSSVAGRSGSAAEQAAAPLIHLAPERDIASPSGPYFDSLKPDGRERKAASDEALCRELCEKSAEMVGIS